MKTELFLKELETLCEQVDYHLRKERGTFRGDSCVIEGDRLIVINKNRPLESQIGILARVLKRADLEDLYIKPAVRKRLAELWERIDRLEQDSTDVVKENSAE